jgi:DNA-directed RNA polymerase specialized sigma24 family protein
MSAKERDAVPADTGLVRKALHGARAGDSAGVHFLYVRYATEVQGYVAGFLGDDEDAAEITESIFADLPGAIAEEGREEAPFWVQISAIARTAVLDHLRARNGAGVSPSHEETEKLRRAFEVLPDEEREVLALRHVAHLTTGEVARALDAPESTVRDLDRHGQEALRAKLAELSPE